MPASASCRARCRSRNTTSPAAACRRSTTAWRRAPTGCPAPPSSAWPARSSCSAMTASPSSSAGPAATCWWRCSSPPTCASSAPTRCPTSSHPLRRQRRAVHGHHRAVRLLLHLRGGADLRDRHHRLALPRHLLRDRGVRRPLGHPALLDARRHARRDLDAGRPVHRADRRLPDPGRLAVDQELRLSDPAADLRQRVAGDHPPSRK
jgi:hypothetical protein